MEKQAIDQASFYISHLDEKTPELYYWGLLSLYNDSEFARAEIKAKYSDRTNPYLYSLIHYSDDAARFKYLYKVTNQLDYLILAYYLTGNLSKLETNQIVKSNYDKIVVNALLHKEKTNIPTHKLSIIDAYLNTSLFKYSINGINIISESTNFTNQISDFLKIRYLNSEDKFDSIINLYRSNNYNFFPISKLKIKILRTISVAYYMKGYYYDSIQLSKNKLIPISKFINDIDLLQKSYSNYGSFLYLIGDITQAQKYYKKAYTIAKSNSDHTNFDILISNLALTYSKLGELNKTISAQYEAYKYALETKNNKTIASIVKNLAFYYMYIEDWDDALTYLKKSYTSSLKSKSLENIIKSQLGLSYYYSKHLKNFDKADSLSRIALTEATKSNNYKFTITALSDRASLFKDFKKYNQALVLQDRILTLAKSKKDWQTWTFSQIEKANLFAQIKNYTLADSALNQLAHRPVNTPLDFIDLVNKTNTEALILDSREEYGEAKKRLSSLKNKIITRAQSSLDRQSGHLMLTDEELETIHLLTDLYLKRDQKTQAIALMDRVKTLNKAAYLNSSVLKSSVFDEKELIRDRLLTKQIEQYRSQLASADSNQVVNIQNKLADAISKKNELENRIINSQNEKPVNVTDIQNKLGNRDAVLYYTQFEDGIYASLITNNRVTVKKLSLSDSLKSVFEDVAHSLQGQHADLTGLHQIYNSLFDSMNVDSYKRLYIVPDGILYQVPFGILPTTPVPNKYSYGSAHYFIEKHEISYYTSLQELYQSWKPTHDKFKLEFAGFGIQKFSDRYSSLASNKVLGALPNTVKEVESIDSLLPGKSRDKRVFIDANATESAFKEYAPEARILHLATHSEVFYNEPLFSVIYMDKKIIQNASYHENDLQDDGQIHAYELFPLHLKSDMVMLSSCESGTGSYITGSGLIGLNRAFTYAGVKSLVMNMWKVDDKAAETVSVQFYKYLKQGMSKDEALRQAKLYYLNNINSDPLKWGSYIVTGKITPLFHPTWDMMAIASRLLIVFIAVVAGYVAYKFNP